MKYDTIKTILLKRCYMNMMLSNIKNTHKHIKQFVYYIYTLYYTKKPP